MKNATVRKSEIFQRWISQPTEEKRYRRFRNKVTQLIRHAKQSAHEKILTKNPTSSISRTLKAFEKSNDSTLPDPEKLLRNDRPSLIF